MKKVKNIGIFDSGIGGLTVANALRKLLPKVSLTYFGDTAHLPYGDKSSESICMYSIRITEFLLKQGCDCIVIACNTASAHAYEKLVKRFGDQVVIFNVIDPVVKAVTSSGINKKIGVIGTKGTISSGVYENKIKEIRPEQHVTSLATPLLAQTIEENFINNEVSEAVLNAYLSYPDFGGIDTLILGCTHYPLIKKQVELFFKEKVDVVATAGVVAETIFQNIQFEETESPVYHFYVTDYTDSFEKCAKLFFQNSVKLEFCPLWESLFD